MKGPRHLLYSLLDYIRERAKDINPRAYQLSALSDRVFRRELLVGLPGVDMDIKVEGDHILVARRAPGRGQATAAAGGLP